MAGSKICGKCGLRKVLSEFGRHGRTTDGRRNTCLRCEREAARLHRLRQREREGFRDRRRGSIASGPDWLAQAERELFPGKQYHELTREERLQAVEYAKELRAREAAA